MPPIISEYTALRESGGVFTVTVSRKALIARASDSVVPLLTASCVHVGGHSIVPYCLVIFYLLRHNEGMVEIDGTIGEGGGQILRSALSLAATLGIPFLIRGIRKNRDRPGLMPQHLAAVRAMKEICRAKVTGDEIASSVLSFYPGWVKPGSYRFDIGTAGSTSLLLQTLILPLIFAGGPSSLSLGGGTHVPFSPSFEYIRYIFIPLLSKLGIAVDADIERYGFYPRGGGKVRVRIAPGGEPRGIRLEDRGAVTSVSGISAVGNLPLGIAERQMRAAEKLVLNRGITVQITSAAVPAVGRGSFVFLCAESASNAAGFTALGAPGKPAEKVGEEAGRELLDYHRSSQCLDPHLADQVLIYLSLATTPSHLTTTCLSRHLFTNLELIKMFVPVDVEVAGAVGSPGSIVIRPCKVPGHGQCPDSGSPV